MTRRLRKATLMDLSREIGCSYSLLQMLKKKERRLSRRTADAMATAWNLDRSSIMQLNEDGVVMLIEHQLEKMQAKVLLNEIEEALDELSRYRQATLAYIQEDYKSPWNT